MLPSQGFPLATDLGFARLTGVDRYAYPPEGFGGPSNVCGGDLVEGDV
jgi:hypothetical protein